jgi:hypothetical protein
MLQSLAIGPHSVVSVSKAKQQLSVADLRQKNMNFLLHLQGPTQLLSISSKQITKYKNAQSVGEVNSIEKAISSFLPRILAFVKAINTCGMQLCDPSVLTAADTSGIVAAITLLNTLMSVHLSQSMFLAKYQGQNYVSWIVKQQVSFVVKNLLT